MIAVDYITITEAAEKWGVHGRTVTYHIENGRIPGIIRKGNLWLIPKDAEKPEDRRKFNKRQPMIKDDSNIGKGVE
jgi:excisionase family DNA binding protein